MGSLYQLPSPFYRQPAFWLDRLITWWIKPELYSCQIVSLYFFFLMRILQYQFPLECSNTFGKYDGIGQELFVNLLSSKYILPCPLLYSKDTCLFFPWQMRLIIRPSSVTMFSVFFSPPVTLCSIWPGGHFSFQFREMELRLCFLLEAILP